MTQGTWRRHLPSQTRLLMAVAIGFCLATAGLTAQAIVQFSSDGGFARSDGQILGGDFLAFYLGGNLYLDDRERLYDLEYQREYRDDLLGEDASLLEGELPFVYPPVVAALSASLAGITFHRAYVIWVFLGLALSTLSLVWLMKTSGATKVVPLPLLLLGSFGFIPFAAQTFLGGQLSWLGVAILATTCAALLNGRDLLAGAIMSLSYYKPPLFLFLLIVLILTRGRRFVVGFALGAALLMTATVVAVGVGGTLDYLDIASRYVYGREMLPGMELPTAQGMGLWALAVNLLPSIPVAIAVLIVPAIFVGTICVRLLRSPESSVRLYGLVLASSATLALSLQVIRYDLALLLVPIILVIAWLGIREEPRKVVVILPFLAFYLEFLAREVQVGEEQYNLASLLFLVLLAILSWQGRQLLHRPARLDGVSGVPPL
jgi:hypothetical protein